MLSHYVTVIITIIEIPFFKENKLKMLRNDSFSQTNKQKKLYFRLLKQSFLLSIFCLYDEQSSQSEKEGRKNGNSYKKNIVIILIKEYHRMFMAKT